MTTLLFLTIAHLTLAQTPDWSKNAKLPEFGRPNPYEIPAAELPNTIRSGRLHALNYPIGVTGIILPYHAVDRLLKADAKDPLKYLLQSMVAGISDLHSMDDLERWLGLKPYPDQEGEGPYFIPFANGKRPESRMGLTRLTTELGEGFTISCAQCHADTIFGRAVLGMSNRFPRANAMFVQALRVTPFISSQDFQWSTNATPGETQMYRNAKVSLKHVDARTPVQLGLDTSLAQVSLSLAKQLGVTPHPNAGDVADSKPAVWWNIKYKTRWLSDGSIVSGNPIFTNFIWNEIGRGTNLKVLSRWIQENPEVVRDLTTAVFSSEAPLWTDFFSHESINEETARRGEGLFNQRCAGCHGRYEKAWSSAEAISLAPADRLKTLKVKYPQPTRVINVGTDPNRHRGMRALLALNDLEISQENSIVIERQYGYVPPPLVGIWARWPYFHNNSVPSLCAVLTRSERRPVTYWARAANNPQTDFDQTCVGYPTSRPKSAESAVEFDTRTEGSSARGHDEGIFLKDGKELLSSSDKMAIIEFLKTL